MAHGRQALGGVASMYDAAPHQRTQGPRRRETLRRFNVAYDLAPSDDPAQLVLLDLDGRVLSRQVIGGAQGIATVSLEDLSAGLYILELLRTDQPSQQVRLVVQ